jgi:hypothetical protein
MGDELHMYIRGLQLSKSKLDGSQTELDRYWQKDKKNAVKV